MIKYFCNKCGKEIESGSLCPSCQEEDLTCGFKVGDVVITDDGKTGFIERFCTCEKCRQRGFYEPKVVTTTGIVPIYITGLDKSDGFASFYRIGSRVFGNIYKNATIRLRQDIEKLKEDIKQYEMQLKVLERLERLERLKVEREKRK